MRLFGLPDGELLRWLGPQTDAENTYVSEEPHRAREGWRAREKDWRESNAYQEWLNKTRHRPGPQS